MAGEVQRTDLRDDKVAEKAAHINRHRQSRRCNVDPKDAEIGKVEVHDGSDAIVEANLTGGILRITEADGLEFEMRVTGADKAELQVVMPPNGPTAKPWKLERVATQ